MIMLVISIITVIIAVLIAFAVIFRRYRSLPNVSFSISLLSTACVVLGDSMSIFRPESVIWWKGLVFVSEAVMVSSWLLFALSFARTNYWAAVSKFSRLLIYLSPLFIVFFITVPAKDFFYSPEFGSERILFLENAGYIFNLFLLLYSIVSIINLEATLRSSAGTNRWNIKYILFGAGGILSINIFYYSHALLYRSLDMNLLPVKTGVILISILLIGYSLLRHKVMDVEVVVSRKILYNSLSLIIVGIYLLGLAVIGEGMRYFGPTAGRNIMAFLGFIGAISVLSIIFSEHLRRKAIVFINKNFYREKYDYRQEWLKFTERISLKHSFDELLASIAEGFKDAVGVRTTAIWLKEKDNGEYVCARASVAGVVNEKPGVDLVELIRDKKWILNIHDSGTMEIVVNNAGFIEKTAASLIVPLLNVDELTGFIILGEGIAGNEYNYEDYDLLKTLARQATAAILNAGLSVELTQAKEMEAMGRLSSFIIHDLKNTASMLSLIVQNAGEHIDNPDFQRDAIKAVSNTAEKIKGIIGKLGNLPKKTSLDLEYSDLGHYVRRVIRQLNMNGDTGLSYKESEPVKTRFDREEMTKVIVNLIINALDATGNQGDIKIEVGTEENMGYVKVSDNGCGMTGEFIEKRLFKPFQTTKKKGLGIGLYQCKTIVEAHSGKLKVVSREGRGTDFFLYLPLAQ
ncbi:MAG TPA: PEP-CTERM system histidine kinase PrsK [Nitrospirae bacterium]|nr:PEP-CTERM system histidine kinase PrsK [Nitrospirota bacterium]